MGQQIGIAPPPRYLGLFLPGLLPIGPTRSEQLPTIVLTGRKEHGHATGVHKTLNLLSHEAAGQRCLPDQQARGFPIDLAHTRRRNDVGTVL